MRHRLYIHLVWTTREREAMIVPDTAVFLDRFIRSICRQERALVLALGMVRDHVHVLLRIHPTTDIPRLVQRLKGGSSVVANRESPVGRGRLRWAKGYSVESVSPRQVEGARAYVLAQGTHHPTLAIPGWPRGRRLKPALG